ncbi:MAG: RsmB/NOP family class I SAM-dependent RNA methyltransferase [Albidovulum sp.]|uniref:RsmB/NOP family class I SAM-dependent RNA methyltransferase n=1 Tax=Albidovulum sp. TaxID=1872424 RepID=UPI003C8B55F5
MTPAARIGAAIEILDQVLAGAAAEQVLTSWARSSRFAGSGDRAAIRDHVFDALRCLRSFTALSGAREPSGRALMIGALLASGDDPKALFSGEGHAPAGLSADEQTLLAAAPAPEDLELLVALDCPDWLAPALRRSLGDDLPAVMTAMRERAPVFLRVNAARGTLAEAQAALAEDNIPTRPHPLAAFALEVTGNARRIKNASAYCDGVVELQDASPQAAVEALPLRPGMRVLDYCAGGGGKSLAMAARVQGHFVAHDAAPQRMRDLPERARRAKARIDVKTPDGLRGKMFDLVVLDVPCSGSGTWRRQPDAKWTLTPERLDQLTRLQSDILDAALAYTAPGGAIAYMTCSLLDTENQSRIAAFLSHHPDWRLSGDRLFTPLEGGDGFYSALLTRI